LGDGGFWHVRTDFEKLLSASLTSSPPRRVPFLALKISAKELLQARFLIAETDKTIKTRKNTIKNKENAKGKSKSLICTQLHD
jgi:hypothetical protein